MSPLRQSSCRERLQKTVRAFRDRAGDRLAVHPRHHQHVAVLGVLDDGRDQSSFVERQSVDHHGVHGQSLTGRSPRREVLLDLPDGELPEVQAGGGEHRVGASLVQSFGEVVEVTGAAARDDRHPHRRRDRSQQLEVVALAGAVSIHRREQHLAGAALGRRLHRPSHGVAAGRRLARVDHDLPAVVRVAGRRSRRPCTACRSDRRIATTSRDLAPPRCSSRPCPRPRATTRSRHPRLARLHRP